MNLRNVVSTVVSIWDSLTLKMRLETGLRPSQKIRFLLISARMRRYFDEISPICNHNLGSTSILITNVHCTVFPWFLITWNFGIARIQDEFHGDASTTPTIVDAPERWKVVWHVTRMCGFVLGWHDVRDDAVFDVVLCWKLFQHFGHGHSFEFVSVGGRESPHQLRHGLSPTPEDWETLGVLEKERVRWVCRRHFHMDFLSG